jgi:ornithine carbamoyltransferase
MSRRDLLNFQGLGRREFDGLLGLAARLKRKQKRGIAHRLLAGKSLAMLFEKPSLRTRATFQTGMSQLGGNVIFLGPAEVGLGTREAPADCARSLARWVDLITVRTFAQKTLEEMAAFSSVPVINALTDLYHPCQVLADCQTLLEHKGRLDGLKIVFAGDGNNMVHSWLEAAAIVPFSFTLACPKGFEPDGDILRKARGAGADITVTQSLEDAARNADALYTDVWTSMGQEAEAETRRQAFRAYQVNRDIVALAKKNAVVMHCLPAHRGEEITDEVLESPQCVAFDQAENRLHAQKAVMVWLLDGFKGAKVQGSGSSRRSKPQTGKRQRKLSAR